MGIRLVVLVAVLVGCHSAGTSLCAGERVCARGLVCDDGHQRCVTPAQITACDGLDDGTQCGLGVGTCDLGVCFDDVCGDGIRGVSEACDDGNVLDGDGCSGDCRSTELCGNGIRDVAVGETCDCGADGIVAADCLLGNADAAGARCRADCLLHCGDGVRNEAEQCDGVPEEACMDFGYDRGALECSSSCAHTFIQCGEIGWKTYYTPEDGSSPHLAVADGDTWFSSGYVFGFGSYVFRYDDGAWSSQFLANNSVVGLEAFSANSAIAVASGGVVREFDGASWTQIGSTGPSPRAVRGTSSDDFYVMGNGQIHHRVNGEWVVENAPVDGDYFDLTILADGTAYAVGGIVDQGGRIWKRGPSSWDEVPAVQSASTLRAVWSADNGEIVAVGMAGSIYHFHDGSWNLVESPVIADFFGVWGSSSDSVFVGGEDGVLVYWNGTSWTELASLDSTIVGLDGSGSVTVAAIESALVVNRGSVWTAPRDGVHVLSELRREPAGLVGWDLFGTIYTDSEEFGLGAPGLLLASVVPLTADDIYASWATWAGPAGVKHHVDRDPVGTDITPPGSESSGFTLCGDSDVLLAVAVGTGEAFFRDYDGDSWTKTAADLSAGEAVNGCQLLSANDAYLRAGSRLHHFDGDGWEEAFVASSTIWAMWARGAELWVGDAGALVHHFDGTSWSSAPVPDALIIRQFAGDDSELFASASGGTLLRSIDGTVWAPMASPRDTGRAIALLGGELHAAGGQWQRLLRIVPW